MQNCEVQMTSDESVGSVTNWLCQLHDGNATDALQALWERYFQRLADVSRTKLPQVARRARDEEDVALSTLDSFFRAANEGRYPDLRDRTDLWPLPVRIAICKSVNQTEREFALNWCVRCLIGGGTGAPLKLQLHTITQTWRQADKLSYRVVNIATNARHRPIVRRSALTRRR